MDDFSISSKLTPPASVSNSTHRSPLSWEQGRQHPKGKPRTPARKEDEHDGTAVEDPHQLDEEA